MITVIYIFAGFGLAFIVGYSKISLPFRDLLDPHRDRSRFRRLRLFLLELIECAACAGFWIGAAFALCDPVAFHITSPWQSILVGAAFSGTNFILGRLTGLIGSAT